MFRLVSNSPSALEGYLKLSESVSKDSLSAATRERIALAVAEINGCSYCLSAHSYLAKKVAKLDDEEIYENRRGRSKDKKAAAAVHFSTLVTKLRGHVSNEDVDAVKKAGYSEEQIIEIVLNVALNTWTNYINEVAKTDIDFPIVQTA